MRRILLTGATGLIGAPLLSLLTEKECEVHAVFRTGKLFATEEPQNVVWHQSDLLCKKEVVDLVRRIQPSDLIHLAWTAGPGTTEDEVNDRWLEASKVLVDAFYECGGDRVLAAGSCFEYDWSCGVFSEQGTALTGKSRYGRAKAALHSYMQQTYGANGRSWCWGRIFFVYGPREHPSRFVSSVITSLLQGQTVRCTHGKQVRDYLHARDVAGALLRLFDSGFIGACNTASGVPATLAHIAQVIAVRLGHPELLQLGARPAPENEPPRIVADVRRLKEEIGWSATLSLEQGLDNTIEWWRDALRKNAGILTPNV